MEENKEFQLEQTYKSDSKDTTSIKIQGLQQKLHTTFNQSIKAN
jgi:hypothetical protein